MTVTWTNVQVTLGELKPWADNPRLSSKRQAQRLLDSWRQFGQVQTVAIGPSNEVYDGHQRLSALLTVHGPSYQVDARRCSRELSDVERRALVVTLHAGAVGSWNWDNLANWDAGELQEWGFDSETLTTWQRDVGALGNLLDSEEAESADAEPQIDRAAELNEKWQVRPGDLWRIGEHRLACGDCTDRAVVERVMAGEKADMVCTDPPYAIYGSSTGIGGDVTDDNMVRPFMRITLAGFCQITNLGAHIYTFCDWRSYAAWWDEARKQNLIVRNCIVWDKGDGGLGANYTMRHEFVVFYEHLPKSVTMTEAARSRNARTVNGRANVQRLNVPQNGERFHNAAKPVKLLEVFIDASSDIGDIVYDPFLGSGTTLVACQNLGRRGRGIEISPEYCAVTLERMAMAFPGIEIERVA